MTTPRLSMSFVYVALVVYLFMSNLAHLYLQRWQEVAYYANALLVVLLIELLVRLLKTK